jgi:hypothetical protein
MNQRIIPLPKEFIDKFPDLDINKAIKFHDKYLNANRLYLVKAIPHISGNILHFPLRQAWDKCGEFQHNNNRYFIWKEFFAIQPYFNVIKEGSKWSGMNSTIQIIDQEYVNLLIDTMDSIELVKIFYNKYDQNERICIPIDMDSLSAYISRTERLLQTIQSTDSRYGKVLQNFRTAKFFKIIGEHYYTQYGDYVIPHIKSDKTTYGRTYYKGINLQNCSKEVRNAALGYHVCYDLNAAAYAIKLILVKNIYDEYGYDFNGSFTYTKEYLDHKSEIRNELASVIFKHMPNHPNPLKLVKEAMTAIGFGAKLHEGSWELEGIRRYSSLHYIIYNKIARTAFAKHKFVVNFLKEQDQLSKIIHEYNNCNMDFLNHTADIEELYNNNGSLNKNKTIAYLYQHLETQIMDMVVKDIVPIFRIHDSFIMSRPLPSETYKDIQQSLNEISPYLKLEKEEYFPWTHQKVFDEELEHKNDIIKYELLANNGVMPIKYTKQYSKISTQSDSKVYDGYDDGKRYEQYDPNTDESIHDMTAEELVEHYRILGIEKNTYPEFIKKLL